MDDENQPLAVEMENSSLNTRTNGITGRDDLRYDFGVSNIKNGNDKGVGCARLAILGKCLPDYSNTFIGLQFGTFAGFTTRCLAYGLRQTKLKHRLHVFDTFIL